MGFQPVQDETEQYYVSTGHLPDHEALQKPAEEAHRRFASTSTVRTRRSIELWLVCRSSSSAFVSLAPMAVSGAPEISSTNSLS
jgi:hypothetical protein